MAIVFTIFFSFLATMSASSASLYPNMHVHEHIDRSPEGFMHSGPIPAQHMLTLYLSLAQSNFKGLKDAFYTVSIPSNPQYGQHLSKEKAKAFITLTSKTIAAVNRWLVAHGLMSYRALPVGDYIHINMMVAQASKLMAVNFASFTHQESGATAICMLEYSIPAILKDHVNFIYPTVLYVLPTLFLHLMLLM